MKPAGAIGDGRTRVLLAAVHEYEERGYALVPAVGRRAGRSRSTTHRHLSELRDSGLIEWDVGRQGTLRPRVRTATFGADAPAPGVHAARGTAAGGAQ